MWTRNIDKVGLHKSAGKAEAVLKAPGPNDVAEVRLFLVLTNYYNGSDRNAPITDYESS